MTRPLISLTTALAVMLTGCGVSTTPTTVSRTGGVNPASMSVAPWNGWYTLNQLPETPGGKKSAVRIVHLKKDEPLGFRTEDHGVVAIAGPLDEPVTPGQYEWVMAADPGQINPTATTILVVIVVVVVALGITIIVAAVDLNRQLDHGFISGGVLRRR